MKKLYLCVTLDEYELPLAVADSVAALAKMRGVSPKTIYSDVYQYRLGLVKRSRYRVVKLDEDLQE